MEVLIFIFGIILGSFYNVVGLRLPNNESIIKPKSHCPNCQHYLKWYENIPIISFLFLKGKCSKCHQNISIIYPLIELLTGILFLISYLLFGFTEYFYISCIISSLIVIIFVSDTKYLIILDSPLIISSILILIIKYFYHGFKEVWQSCLFGLLIFGIMYILMLIGNWIFKKESLGGGDIKLSFVSGLVLGPLLGVFYIVLASFLAFPYAIYSTIKKKENMLPFGPFLAVSMLIIYFNKNFFLDLLDKLININMS